MARFSPIQALSDAKTSGEPAAMISLYDAPTAELCCDAGADCLLVGDSLGNVVLGYDNFISVTMADMIRHTNAVARGVERSSRPGVPVVADLPFGSYTTVADATANSAALMRAGAHAVKLEGAGPATLDAVRAIVEMGAPVVGHLGFTPQSALRFSGVVQGKTAEAAEALLRDALALEEAGCSAVVLEAVTREVAEAVTKVLSIPTVGIGAGAGCDGQVLVWHDLAGLSKNTRFRFVKRYADARAVLAEATREFVEEVRSGEFPKEEHGWSMTEDELDGWRGRPGADGELRSPAEPPVG